MKKLIAFIFLFATAIAFSQEEVKYYKWDDVPKFREIPEQFKSYPAVVLKDYRLYDNRVGEYAYKAFVVKHVAIKIQQTEGINDFNKVSINYRYVRDYRDLKARVIKANGKVEELSQNRIIEKDNSDEKQFVFEGVEVGDIIEYYYVIKDFPDFRGVEYFQRTIPVMDGKFQINNISQGATVVNAYNGMHPETIGGYQIYTVKDLPAYKEEKYAENLANLAKLYYRVSIASDFGWNAFYNTINRYSEGENARSMVKTFIKNIGFDDTSISLDERLKKMDIYIKENFEVDRMQKSYKTILETKKVTPSMILFLYKDVLESLKIPYEFIASTDKFENHFDQQNAVPGMLSELMIYIPETDKYICPFDFWIPYGPPTSVTFDNTGISYGTKEKQGSYSFIIIGGISMDDNVSASVNEISIDDAMENVTVKKKKTFTGYSSYSLRSTLKTVPQDKLKEYVKNINYEGVDVDINTYTIENQEYRNNYDDEKPLTFNTEVQIKESWVENAGKNYVVTIGKVLGNQLNFYQETERENPIDLNYPKKYEHTIRFNIPKGYTVKSIDNLSFHRELKDEKGVVIGLFESKGNIENGIVTITIEEFYNFTHLEKDRYPEYRELVNGAADFYKSSIVLLKA
ncbi:DUF3857 domain-containing protein [Flavobacterium sp.]|uniref:DUF3857 domain-containing protein n=1 Tax=Flavobacterium sp. TaxID=239 RepID=UPI00286C14D2|nr:DUF3857 domain-containing protein [Flavobacterium sp.]